MSEATVVVVSVLAIVKVSLSLLPEWFASPAKVTLAVAVPTATLPRYVIDAVKSRFRPPNPVTTAVQGVSAEPVYWTGVVGQLTVVVEDARPMLKARVTG